jgi:hypothetical protein
MSIEEAIELIQEQQSKEGLYYEKVLLIMAEAALVDLVNYWSDGPSSQNVEKQIKDNWT